jgi:hypothetical protein
VPKTSPHPFSQIAKDGLVLAKIVENLFTSGFSHQGKRLPKNIKDATKYEMLAGQLSLFRIRERLPEPDF